ncbi:MAG: hypothetical protein N5P05_001820 [Chroococcopsis gigantea SAG 12.99]|jgi:small-conductance mechanosensitive channel|nr:hypothetical protein [Chroococcopsis gigantea SAG 12.99]
MDSSETPIATVIPAQWLRQLEKLAAEKESSVSEVIKKAIEQYLITNDSNPDLRPLKQQIQQLSEQVQILRNAQHKINHLDLRVCILEKKVLPTLSPDVAEDGEEYEDEPDEVLTDFI